MKTRGLIAILVVVAAVVAAACSSGGSGKAADDGLGSGTTVPAAQSAACKSAVLTSPEVGVTPKTITVTVMADVDNGFRPGLFKGAWDGVKAWGDYMNANGGLACRKVVVKAVDSHLNADESKAGVAQACKDSVAMVGTTSLFLSDVSGMNSCKDKAGVPTGLLDVPLVQTEAVHQCSPVSYSALPTGAACPYSGTGVRRYDLLPLQYDYYFNKFGRDIHGVMVIPKDTQSTINTSMSIYRAENKAGVKSDAEFGVSGLATQPQYTPVVQAIKQHNSNYARSLLDYKGMVLERKEAAAQGVNDQVKIWDCSINCYDNRLTAEGGKAVDGTYVWMSILPMEDKGSNAELDSFIKYDKHPDGWGMQAWVSAEAFARAVNDTIAADNSDPNSITRANVLAAVKNLHAFDANGMVPATDIGNKGAVKCAMGLQVQNGKFVRIFPSKPGTFDCNGDKPLTTINIDAAKEYKG